MPNPTPRALIEGRPALIVIDIQASTFIDDSDERSIPNMPGYRDRMTKARQLVDKAHEWNIPVVFIQEAHRPDLIDFDESWMAMRQCIALRVIRGRNWQLSKWVFARPIPRLKNADILRSLGLTSKSCSKD